MHIGRDILEHDMNLSDQFRFQIALSFPGEFRARVAKVAEALAAVIGRNSILFDEWHRAEFARPNLDVSAETLP
jgi:hypothetical protein